MHHAHAITNCIKNISVTYPRSLMSRLLPIKKQVSMLISGIILQETATTLVSLMTFSGGKSMCMSVHADHEMLVTIHYK